MDNTYWLKQTSEPLFEDIIWSRPETKRLAKRLLVVGGTTGSFMNIATSFQQALDTGIGECKAVLPDKLQRTVGKYIDNVIFLPSDHSGGIAKDASVMLHEYSEWGDGVLFPGDLGRGSETTRFIERFVSGTSLPLIMSGDSINNFYENPEIIFDKEDTVLVMELKQLQKVAPRLGISNPITHTMGLVQLVELLHTITQERESMIVTAHQENILVSMYGEVSTTHAKVDNGWQSKIAAKAAVYFVQHPEKPFQAITTSILHNDISR